MTMRPLVRRRRAEATRIECRHCGIDWTIDEWKENGDSCPDCNHEEGRQMAAVNHGNHVAWYEVRNGFIEL